MTRLSNRQFPLLETFATNIYLKIDEAQAYDQRPFRSLLIRRYIAYKPGYGFHITREGKQAREEFFHTDIGRRNPTLPLTAYFDPTAYGLKIQPKKAQVPRNAETQARGVNPRPGQVHRASAPA